MSDKTDEKTIADVFNKLTNNQKNNVYAIVGDEKCEEKISFEVFLKRYPKDIL